MMNRLDREDLNENIKSVTSKQNLSEMVQTLSIYVDSLRVHISQGADQLVERKDEIDRKIEGSRMEITHILKRLESIDQSVAQTIIHYHAISEEIKKGTEDAVDQ